MTTQIINVPQAAKGIRSYAKGCRVFHDIAIDAAQSVGPKVRVFKADGSLSAAATAHLDSFRELLMDGATAKERAAEGWEPNPESLRDVWNATGAGPDSSFRANVAHMVHAIAGLWVLAASDDPEQAAALETASFEALRKAGVALMAEPAPKRKADDGESVDLADLASRASALVKTAPRKKPTPWEKDAIHLLTDLIAALTPPEEA